MTRTIPTYMTRYAQDIVTDYLRIYVTSDKQTQTQKEICDFGIDTLPVMRILGVNHENKFQILTTTPTDTFPIINVNTETDKKVEILNSASLILYSNKYLTKTGHWFGDKGDFYTVGTITINSNSTLSSGTTPTMSYQVDTNEKGRVGIDQYGNFVISGLDTNAIVLHPEANLVRPYNSLLTDLGSTLYPWRTVYAATISAGTILGSLSTNGTFNVNLAIEKSYPQLSFQTSPTSINMLLGHDDTLGFLNVLKGNLKLKADAGDVYIWNTLIPGVAAQYDLGGVSNQFKNGYFNGTLRIDTVGGSWSTSAPHLYCVDVNQWFNTRFTQSTSIGLAAGLYVSREIITDYDLFTSGAYHTGEGLIYMADYFNWSASKGIANKGGSIFVGLNGDPNDGITLSPEGAVTGKLSVNTITAYSGNTVIFSKSVYAPTISAGTFIGVASGWNGGTITQDIIPSPNDNLDLGRSGSIFNQAFINTLLTNAIQDVTGNDTIYVLSNFIPNTVNYYSLGNTVNYWNIVTSNDLYVNVLRKLSGNSIGITDDLIPVSGYYPNLGASGKAFSNVWLHDTLHFGSDSIHLEMTEIWINDAPMASINRELIVQKDILTVDGALRSGEGLIYLSNHDAPTTLRSIYNKGNTLFVGLTGDPNDGITLSAEGVKIGRLYADTVTATTYVGISSHTHSATQITSDTLNIDRIPGSLNSKITWTSIGDNLLPSIGGSFNIGEGTFRWNAIVTTSGYFDTLNPSGAGVNTITVPKSLYAATLNAGTYLNIEAHTHSATQVTSGTFSLDRIPSNINSKVSWTAIGDNLLPSIGGSFNIGEGTFRWNAMVAKDGYFDTLQPSGAGVNTIIIPKSLYAATINAGAYLNLPSSSGVSLTAVSINTTKDWQGYGISNLGTILIDEIDDAATGNITIATNWVPKTDVTYDLGLAGYKWNRVYSATMLTGNLWAYTLLPADGVTTKTITCDANFNINRTLNIDNASPVINFKISGTDKLNVGCYGGNAFVQAKAGTLKLGADGNITQILANTFIVGTGGNPSSLMSPVGIYMGNWTDDAEAMVDGGTKSAMFSMGKNGTRYWHFEKGYSNEGDPFRIVESGVAYRLSILKTSGYIGIGTDSPTAQLEVNGTIKATAVSAATYLNYPSGGGSVAYATLAGTCVYANQSYQSSTTDVANYAIRSGTCYLSTVAISPQSNWNPSANDTYGLGSGDYVWRGVVANTLYTNVIVPLVTDTYIGNMIAINHNTTYLGKAGNVFGGVVAYDFHCDNAYNYFDALDDLAIVKNYKRVVKTDKNGIEREYIDSDSMEIIKSDEPEANGALSQAKSMGLLFGCIKKLVQKVEELEDEVKKLKNIET